MKLFGPLNSGVAAGGAGVATNNTTSSTVLVGEVLGIYVSYKDAPPATTDVTVKALGTTPSAPTYNLLALVNKNTSGWFYPLIQVCDTTGTPIAATYDHLMLHDYINVSIAGANNADSVDVWLMLAGE